MATDSSAEPNTATRNILVEYLCDLITIMMLPVVYMMLVMVLCIKFKGVSCKEVILAPVFNASSQVPERLH